MRWRDTLARISRVRLTPRGIGAACLGGALIPLGLVLTLPDLVGLGAAALLAVTVAWVAIGTQRLESGRGALHVTRAVTPNPVVRDRTADVSLLVAAHQASGAAYERLSRLRLSEQAAHELAGHQGIRARVSARADRITVHYSLTPTRRGRWSLGPLLTTRTDVFGLVRATQPLGSATHVPVWPRTVELAVRTRSVGDVDHSATGARLQSSDDSVLREYVAGDDPRRVHWASAARRGQLMVRADESAGVRPVTVLLDRSLLPHRQEAGSPRRPAAVDDGEWAVELAASIATSFLDAGHPTRLLTTAVAPRLEGLRFATTRASRAALLDACVDIRGHRGAAEGHHATSTTARALRLARTAGEIVIAVLGPHDPDARHALAALGVEGTCWALLVSPRGPGFQHELDETAAELRASGWHVSTSEARTDPERAWALLAEGAL
ncbi:Uncharacterized conserved protein, DUF58 family, contains vWF domain [Promicromonospora umidemergens]|uniref:DUF58 domain-containing protein n=1 Tax=Promicromonospora umidemergens TaxID=629679 RepID=A0ABP8XYT7_9MICO|nr:DUF58 domain-containing protein [Promicromonospora umidemergens]MCP2284221.1 Uncharacterized conserved protein, DUF58 family, contains vWF domain [Promicromonospora umidemergens]